MPVALAACRSFPAYLRIAWQDFVDSSASGGERLLRWRDGSICCAISCRYRNGSRLSRKTLSAFFCVRGRVRSASRHQSGGAPGRGEQAGVARTCAVAQGRAPPPHLHQLSCLFARPGTPRLGRPNSIDQPTYRTSNSSPVSCSRSSSHRTGSRR